MIRFGPAGAPRWFDQRLDRLEEYLEHIRKHGAGCIEYVVHGGSPGEDIERVHLSEPIWEAAVAAAHKRGLDVHLHAPLTPQYRLGQWDIDRAGLINRYLPIIELLAAIEKGQDRSPVIVLHAASSADREPDHCELVTAEFVGWLVDSLERLECAAGIAIELRLPGDDGDMRFDRDLSHLVDFVSAVESAQVGICWDIANYFGADDRKALPSPDALVHIKHVHLHDRHPAGGGFHAPLQDGLPWQSAIEHLQSVRWHGAVTLEIRYRYALEQGRPWDVLADSLDRVHQLSKE